MSLIQCPECGRDNVSTKAKMCPNCGFAIQEWVHEQEQITEIENQREAKIRSIDEAVNKMVIPSRRPKSNSAIIMGVVLIAISALSCISTFVLYYTDAIIINMEPILIIGFILLIIGIALVTFGKSALSKKQDLFDKYKGDQNAYKQAIANSVISDIDTVSNYKIEKVQEKATVANAIPRCPKCGSTAITSGARGVNFTWGLIGASKTVNRCANCGNTWDPRK